MSIDNFKAHFPAKKNFPSDIPIYQISVKGNPKAEYYSPKSVYSFKKFGYNNIQVIEAVTPDTYQDRFRFSDRRIYGSGKSREWDHIEKVIWESHAKVWEMIDRPSIVIEHDCILKNPLDGFIYNYPLFSFGATPDYRSLAACAYFIQPYMAKHMLEETIHSEIHMPVDGYIHLKEPWYPLGKLPKWHYPWVFAMHYINDEIGTIKKKLGS